MMAEYIDRYALEVALNHRLNFLMAENGEYDHYTSGFDEAVTRVEDFPAADVARVRHGRWVEYENESDMGYHYCSECKHQAFNYDEGVCNVEILSDYCPNCGAKMDKED